MGIALLGARAEGLGLMVLEFRVWDLGFLDSG